MSAQGGDGPVVVGVATVADRVGVVVRADAAAPWRPGARLLADPVVVTRQGADVGRWVTDSVQAVRLAVVAAASPSGLPPVAAPRPLAGGFFEWHPLITGGLLATPDLGVELVAPRWVDLARQRRLATATDPTRPDPQRDPEGFTRWRGTHPQWRCGFPPELIGPREQSGGGVRQVLRAAWDVAGGAGLRLAERIAAVPPCCETYARDPRGHAADCPRALLGLDDAEWRARCRQTAERGRAVR